MVTVVVVEFGVKRCQPLRRALCCESKLTQILFFAVTEQFL
ncbi:acetyltransferase [Vibrio mimicus]